MSSSLVRQYVDVVGSLKRREPVQVRLPIGPNGTVVTAIPEEVEFEGRKLMELHIIADDGDEPIEAKVRMSVAKYEKSIVKAENAVPRVAAVQRRLLLRE